VLKDFLGFNSGTQVDSVTYNNNSSLYLVKTANRPNNTYIATTGANSIGGGTNSMGTMFRRNTVREQTIGQNDFGILQDELSDYTYLKCRLYDNSGSFFNGGVVFDGVKEVWSHNPQGLNLDSFGTLRCVRLYNSNLYFFSSSGTTFYINRVSLPSGTLTTYTFSGLPNSISDMCVFNWPVSNKFWIALSINAGFRIFTFDLTSASIAQFGPTSSSTSIGSFSFMHVKSDGTGVTVVNDANSTTNILTFTTGSSSIVNDVSFNWRNTTQRFFITFQASFGAYIIVTPDCLLNTTSYRSVDVSNTRYTLLLHIQGGESVLGTEFVFQGLTGDGLASPQLQSTSLVTRDEAYFQTSRYHSVAGYYQVSRSGSTLVVGTTPRKAITSLGNYANVITASKIDSFIVTMATNGPYLSNFQVYSNEYTLAYGFNTLQRAVFGAEMWTSTIGQSAFITKTGEIFLFPIIWSNQVDNTGVYPITTKLPIRIQLATKNYKVTLIGGGARWSGSGDTGTSSQFLTYAAAPGSSDGIGIGGNVGIPVIGTTSNGIAVTANTGGKGITVDNWGAGEDARGTGVGGGSGYITVIPSVTLNAGTTYAYKAGFGPLYGKQGAILLEEL
jgi:hypothetical protein